MVQQQIENARIDTVSIDNDGDILTFSLGLEGDGWCVSYGCVLDSFDRITQQRRAHPLAMECIREIMKTIGVNRWEDLEGKYCRVKNEGLGKSICEIGNIISDKWFNYKTFFGAAEQ